MLLNDFQKKTMIIIGFLQFKESAAGLLPQVRNERFKMCNKKTLIQVLIVILLSLCFALPNAFSLTIEVSNESALQNEINLANQRGGDTDILIGDGIYRLTSGIIITAPGISLQGKSQQQEKVIIEGDAMSANANVGNVLTIAASDISLRYLTLQKCRNHLIQIRGELNADGASINNCTLRDSYEQMIKVSVDMNNTSISGDNGTVENCRFEYTEGIGPQWYIGGIDAHAADNWVIRNNTFKYIISPSSAAAEFAVHFWNGSSGNLVENNLIIDCDRGIGFGLQGKGNAGGTIQNNMIYHSPNRGNFADTGIALTESPDTRVYNNTVYLEHSFPWAIEYRFSTTKNIIIANNLTNKPIQERDGASATSSQNVTTAVGNWFIDIENADLHISGNEVASVVDKGVFIEELGYDIDGEMRPSGNGFDVGADEIYSSSEPAPPRNLTIIW